MNKLFPLKATLVAAALLALPLAQATTLSKTAYGEGKSRISASYKADQLACASLAGNAKDICSEEAKGREKVARAELEYNYSGKSTDGNKVRVAKAEAAYAIAREKCDDLAGNPKDVCIKEAKAVEVKALEDAKRDIKVGAAQNDAADAKRDANYKVEAEKCEALAGDAKSSCIASAKSAFGKT